MSDSALESAFWDERYLARRTPWDFGDVPAALRAHLDAHPGGGARVLIPGCGSGYEIEAFARAGYAVIALDFSAPAVARAQARFGHLGQAIVHGDFFTHDFGPASFDVIYERTFLCALPPERWAAIAARSNELLRPHGRLIGFYYFGAKDDGPPFGFASGEDHRLFGNWFTLVENEPSTDPLPLFAGNERWQVRRKRTIP